MILENCENPKYINKTIIGCNKCPTCKNKKRNEWSVRLEHELIENGGKGTFITLTYNDENLIRTGTKSIVDGDELGTLSKPDLQKFLKRLRKKLEKEEIKIKYIASGEYGTAFKRPHYHIIILGINYDHFTENEWEKIWGKGKVDVDKRKVSSGCINYINNYIKKNEYDTKEKKINFQKEYNRIPEFITQSQGIGKKWAEKNVEGWTKSMVINNNGHKNGIPRYYIKLIKKMEGKIIKIKRTIINFYENETVKNEYTYYKVIENINGKYTKRIIENSIKTTEELIKKIKENKEEINDKIIKNLNQILENKYEEIKEKQYKYENIEKIKKLEKTRIAKNKYKPLKENQIKKINKESIKKIIGKKMQEKYEKMSKQKNDIIRIKIEKTKRNYDKNEKNQYILNKIKKLKVDKNKKTRYINNKINLVELGGIKIYEYKKRM